MFIPFNRPYITGNELKYVESLVRGGGKLSGDGPYTKKVSALIESRFGAKKALMTTSCTSALELATHLLRLKPGDQVILPSFTFVSTANPIVLAGATPVFADVDPATLNIDPEDVRRKVTKKTRAIYPVHYAGVACDMEALMDIAREHGLYVVEDAAQGVNARHNGRYLGAIGHLGCYSFHETKNYVCGEGGALLVNAGGRELAERAEVLREKGTNRSQFYRGEVDKYTWVDIGSSYLPSDVLAAFLYAQLEKLDEIQEKRMRVYGAYGKALRPYEREGLLRLPGVPAYARHNAHLFYILLNDEAARDRVMARLKALGVMAIFHYVPLHTSAMGARVGGTRYFLPVTDDASRRLLRLPLYAGMTDAELAYTVAALEAVLNEEMSHAGKQRIPCDTRIQL